MLLSASRYGLPALLVLAGFAALIIDEGTARFDGFAMLVVAGLSVALLNALFRVGAVGDREREDDERARLLLRARPLARRDTAQLLSSNAFRAAQLEQRASRRPCRQPNRLGVAQWSRRPPKATLSRCRSRSPQKRSSSKSYWPTGGCVPGSTGARHDPGTPRAPSEVRHGSSRAVYWLNGRAAASRASSAWATPPGVVFLTLRVAVTGARRSPPLHPVMEVLGEAEVERRLGRALEALRPS